MLVKTPSSLFGEMRIRHPEDLALCFGSVCISSAPGAVFVLVLGATHIDLTYYPYLQVIIAAVAVFFLTGALLAVLSWIEYIGVDFFSRRRNWRVQKHVARAVCANAMPGWMPTGVFVSIGLGLLSALQFMAGEVPTNLQPWVQTAAVAMPVLGFIAGMLIFETLVYIGVRRCKFANWIERPARGDAPAPASQADETHTN
jgi:hypothetical protein